MRLALAVATVSALTVTARADGVYVVQSVGVGHAHGDLALIVGNAIRTRLGVGARVRWLAIEPWLQSDVQTSRSGGVLRGFIGGDPAPGRADLDAYGFDVKLLAPLYRGAAGELVEGYVRGGPCITGATGALDGYRGYGAGVAAGVKLTGRVRALGFLWAPLFLTSRGPRVIGSLYFDQGFDFYRLARHGRQLDARIGHVTIGFGLGSGF